MAELAVFVVPVAAPVFGCFLRKFAFGTTAFLLSAFVEQFVDYGVLLGHFKATTDTGTEKGDSGRKVVLSGARNPITVALFAVRGAQFLLSHTQFVAFECENLSHPTELLL